MTALEDFGGPEHVDDRWRIDGDNTATWALRKLAALRAEADRLDRAAEAEASRIDAWHKHATDAIASDVAFFQARLSEYLRQLRSTRPELKTYKLPTGTIQIRSTPGSTRILDENALIAWAEENEPDLVTTRKTVSKTAIKKYAVGTDGVSLISETGERIPYVEHVPGEERIVAKPTESGTDD